MNSSFLFLAGAGLCGLAVGAFLALALAKRRKRIEEELDSDDNPPG